MKVVLVSHSSAVDNLGGAELTLLHLIDEWRRLRNDVEFFVIARTPTGLLQGELDQRSVSHESIDFDSWVLPLVREVPFQVLWTARMDSQAVARMAELIDEFAGDIVVSNTIVSPWGALAARSLGLPHVWMVHEYGDLDHGLGFRLGRDRTFEDIGILSDVVVANSEAVRNHVSQWVPSDKLAIAYPPIDLERARRLARSVSPEVPTTELRVVMVGRLAPSKGQWRLLRAMATLRTEGVPIRATIVGGLESEDARQIVTLADTLGLSDAVDFVGETDNPFRFIAAADVGVTASDSEAFGRVTVEYLALGLPVIATDAGANPELVEHGVTGWLFDAHAPDGLTDALREAHSDRDEVLRRGTAARRRVEEGLAHAYPLEPLISRVEELKVQGARAMVRLPNITREWLELPLVVERYLADMHLIRSAAHASMTWRLGRLITVPLRFAARLKRGRRGA
ncbi:MAG: glycosyltransferase [Salinibacterium sp.]|nr:glycosyltransferase [Salinibacterium sp.]MBF0673453.1 glycosyltransferase [Salinibacterium sp.]